MEDTLYLKDNLAGTVPVEIAKKIIKNIREQASILNVCKLENMTSDTKYLPYLTDSGAASWVNEGDSIGTTIPKFSYPQLIAKKLAVIIPVTNEKNNDSVVNVMEELKQAIADAFANAIDSAMIFGTDSPFDTNLITSIGAQKITATSSLDKDISEAMGIVEDNKLSCTNILMGNSRKKVLRELANDSKYKGAITLTSAFETPIEFVKNFDDTKAITITGDFSKAIIGTREGIEYKVLDQATIGTGDTAINLAQRDMIAIKATMRLGFVVAEPKAFSMVVGA